MWYLVSGGEVSLSWNETILRPLPKTEAPAGLYDINKTRPIALMEVALKLMERVIFSRINKVIDDNTMLREEQSHFGPVRKAPSNLFTINFGCATALLSTFCVIAFRINPFGIGCN